MKLINWIHPIHAQPAARQLQFGAMDEPRAKFPFLADSRPASGRNASNPYYPTRRPPTSRSAVFLPLSVDFINLAALLIFGCASRDAGKRDADLQTRPVEAKKWLRVAQLATNTGVTGVFW